MSNYKQKKSSCFCSLLSVFKARRAKGGGDSIVDETRSAPKVFPSYNDENEAGNAGRVYHSDYDTIHGMVAYHKVDIEAEKFIGSRIGEFESLAMEES